jgi:hypothetical protein
MGQARFLLASGVITHNSTRDKLHKRMVWSEFIYKLSL